ncbi:unnamed protein product [Ixodes pacificus]
MERILHFKYLIGRAGTLFAIYCLPSSFVCSKFAVCWGL